MKKVLIIISLLIFGFASYSQEVLHPLKYYKVAFHIVRTSAGTTNRVGLETDIQKAIKYMNTKYIGANVQFYICDIYYIDNDTYYDFNTSDQNTLMQTYNISDAINVYLFNSMPNLWGYTYQPIRYNPNTANFIGLRHEIMDLFVTVTHEFGHFFGLPHTHDGTHEYVDGSNCSTAGDKFCDTPADPDLQFETYVNENCEYTGDMVDGHGDPYDPDVTLIMSYARHKCRTRFSQEQLAEINFWANHLVRLGFSHMHTFEDVTLSSNQDIEEDVILIKNTKIENNIEVNLKPCAFVEISGDSEVKLGSILNITIE